MNQTREQQLDKALLKSYRIEQAGELIHSEDSRATLKQSRESTEFVHSQENRLLKALTSRKVKGADAMTDEDDEDTGISLGDKYTETHHHHHHPPEKKNVLPWVIAAASMGIGGGSAGIVAIQSLTVAPVTPVIATETPDDADTKYELRISSGDHRKAKK